MRVAAYIFASLAAMGCLTVPSQGVLAGSVQHFADGATTPAAGPARTAGKPAAVVYRNADLQLVYQYPAPLEEQRVHTFQEALARSHRRGEQVAPAWNRELAGASRDCMHVLMYATTPEAARVTPKPGAPGHGARAKAAASAQATLPQGTVTVGEFDKSCVPVDAVPNDILGSLASIPGQLPGFRPIDQQMWYEVDKHKVHFLAAQSQTAEDTGRTDPMVVAVASVEVHDHLLFWMFMSDSTPLLNQLLNSTVQFDAGTPAPLFPMAIGPQDEPAAGGR